MRFLMKPLSSYFAGLEGAGFLHVHRQLTCRASVKVYSAVYPFGQANPPIPIRLLHIINQIGHRDKGCKQQLDHAIKFNIDAQHENVLWRVVAP